MIVEEEIVRQQTIDIAKSYDGTRGKLIPVLQEIQAKFGYLPREAIEEVAEFMRVTEIEIYGVATFYNQFRLTPPGKHQIKVCMGTACHIKGGKVILEAWERELGIKEGETSADREFSMERVACIGCCAMAPVCVADEVVHGKVTPTRISGILLSYKLQEERKKVED